jgi:hypothetical protein
MIKPVPLCAYPAMVALAACAVPQDAYSPQYAQSRGPQCFRVNEVYGYSEAGARSVDLNTAQGPFRMHLGPGCPDFSWIMQIGIRPMESSWLCEGKTDVLITATPVPGNACIVGDIERLEPSGLAEAARSRPTG